MPLVELTAADLELRKQGIGASEIGAIAGLNPFQSALDVFFQKTGRAQPRPDDDRSRMGKRLEILIEEWYCDEICPDRFEKAHTMIHPSEPWMLATPDGIVDIGGYPRRRAEIKLVGRRVRPHWQRGETVFPPEYVLSQTFWQGLVSGIEPCDVAVWFGTDRDEQHIISIPWMADVAESLQEIGYRFWHEHVLRDTPPPVDSSESWREYLGRLWPRNERPILMGANSEADSLALELSSAKRAIKQAKETEDYAENGLKALIGNGDGLIHLGKWRATWKCDANGTVDWKSVALALGATDELAEQYRRDPPRRFLFKEF